MMRTKMDARGSVNDDPRTHVEIQGVAQLTSADRPGREGVYAISPCDRPSALPLFLPAPTLHTTARPLLEQHAGSGVLVTLAPVLFIHDFFHAVSPFRRTPHR